MANGHTATNPFIQVLEEIGIAAIIIVGHGFLAVLTLIVGAIVHKALDYFSTPDHVPELAGVSARFIIEGGEIMLTAVVMIAGVLSAVVLFGIRLVTHLKG